MGIDNISPSGSVSISGTISVVPQTNAGSVLYDNNFDAERVVIVGNSASESLGVFPSVGGGTFQVFLPDTGHELGSIKGINSSINVYLGATAGTIRVGDIPGSVAVYFSPSNPTVAANFSGSMAVYFDRSKPIVLADIQSTQSIFTISGSVTGVSVSGNTILSPSASYNFKIFGFNLFTTGISSILAKWVNGAGGGQTEFYRGLATPGTPSAIDMEVTPPGYLFATGLNTTLALLLDSGSLVHYSVSYIKESA